MGHDIHDEPLKPECKPSLPPWVSRFTNRGYHGRLEWWGDLGYKDIISRMKKFRGQYAQYDEQDRYWWDAPVEKGVSVYGPNGLDGSFYPNLTFKGDQPGNFFEFQKKKWELSKEHPGLDVNPTLSDLSHYKFSQLGKGLVQFVPNSWHHYGPRFWDKPLNEGCFEKAMCGVKYAAIFTMPYTIFDLKVRPPPNMPISWGFTVIAQRYVKFLPFPCTLAFAYNLSLCTSATIRNIDDTWNFLAASSMMGITLATIKENISAGVITCLASFFVGVVTQYARCSIKGIQNRSPAQATSGGHFGPLSWNSVNFGDAPVSTKKY